MNNSTGAPFPFDMAAAAGGRPLPRPLGAVVRALRDAWNGAAEPHAPPPEPDIVSGARFTEGEQSDEAGSRRYRLYLPASLGAGAPAGIVMMLHGCLQTPEDFALGTRMNELAEIHRLIIVYPGQASADNGKGCWNWFRPGHQGRGRGEPAILAGLAARLAAEHRVPKGRVFAAGLSAGGSMAAVLGASYPEVFAAIGVHSGVAQGCANDTFSALAMMRGDWLGAGAPGVPVPLIVFHGDADDVVHPANAARLATAGRDFDKARTLQGTAGGRRFIRTVDRGGKRDGGAVPALECWVIEGAGHAWSGGNPDGSFADALGPDASAEMIRFFLGSRSQPSALSSA